MGCRIIRTSPSYLPPSSGQATGSITHWYMTMPPLSHAPDAVGLPLCCGVMLRFLSLPPLPPLVTLCLRRGHTRIFRCRRLLSLTLRDCLMTRFSGTIPTLPSCLVPILTCTLRKRSSRGGWPLLISHCARSVLGTLSGMSWLLLPWLTGGFLLSSPLLMAAQLSSLPHSGLWLGAVRPLVFPPTLEEAFHGLGNCISVPQAAIPWTVLLRAVGLIAEVPEHLVLRVWRHRLRGTALRPAVVRGWYFVGALDQLIDFAFHPQAPARADAEGPPVVVGEEAFPNRMGAARSILHSPSGLRVEVTYPVGASVSLVLLTAHLPPVVLPLLPDRT